MQFRQRERPFATVAKVLRWRRLGGATHLLARPLVPRLAVEVEVLVTRVVLEAEADAAGARGGTLTTTVVRPNFIKGKASSTVARNGGGSQRRDGVSSPRSMVKAPLTPRN